ncbi:hypothetical protein BX600DRAFT_51836 [Xylariales sp. PMI_506]|nr:hypothetical protein BX600DRAFT_51836 [Xylariales sp. PMI_506]
MGYNSVVAFCISIVFILPITAQELSLSGCVDQENYTNCYNRIASDLTTCVNACAGGNLCIIACGCVAYTAQFACVIESCWNQVYSCEYQAFAVGFADGCNGSGDGVPFWPAPTDAPNSCSCNLETLYDTVVAGAQGNINCTQRVTDTLDITDPVQGSKNITGCACCGASGAFSALHAVCPNTEPSLLDIDKITADVTLELLGESFSTCDSTLATFNCETDLGFSALPNDGAYYASSNMPPSGTQTLFNSPGSMTTAPFGSVTTIFFSTTSYVLTAAPYNSDNANAAGSTLTGTTGSAAATPTTSKSGATAVTVNYSYTAIIAIAGLIAVLAPLS